MTSKVYILPTACTKLKIVAKKQNSDVARVARYCTYRYTVQVASKHLRSIYPQLYCRGHQSYPVSRKKWKNGPLTLSSEEPLQVKRKLFWRKGELCFRHLSHTAKKVSMQEKLFYGIKVHSLYPNGRCARHKVIFFFPGSI